MHGATWKPYKASQIICNHHTSTISTHLNPNITKHMSKDLSMNPENSSRQGYKILKYIKIYYNILKYIKIIYKIAVDR